MLAVDGRLVLGQRLPSERELAVRLSLSRTTVTAAYARLRDGGYLRARRGAGNFVTLPHRRAASGFVPGSLRTREDEIGWNCASGAAAPGLAAAYARAAERLPELLSGPGYLPDGLDDLRTRIAAWYVRRGLDTDPDQVVVTTGALSAFIVVATTVLGRGDRLLLESPTYTNALEATRRAGPRPVGYPLPDDGWQPSELGRTLDQTASRAAYLIPEHQNPTGLSMEEETRRRSPASCIAARSPPSSTSPWSSWASRGSNHPARRSAPRCHQPRIGQQGLLGWATGRLDSRTARARAAAGRDEGLVGPRHRTV